MSNFREKAAEGKYLAAEDIPGDWPQNGLVLTIKEITQENVARQDQKPQDKPVIYFEESDYKPMVLNKGNTKLTLKWWPGEDSACIGKKVLVYTDPNTNNPQTGENCRGLRLEQPSAKGAGEPDDGIPF